MVGFADELYSNSLDLKKVLAPKQFSVHIRSDGDTNG